MTEDEDIALCEKYPKIFKNRNSTIMETCMAWGFECGSGWFDIIDILCHEIQNHVDWKSKDLSEEEKESLQVVAEQVKEKYGTLRFYYYGGDEIIEGMVSMAESMSHRICEDCGCPGEHKSCNNYIRTLCNTCDDKWKATRGIVRCV